MTLHNEPDVNLKQSIAGRRARRASGIFLKPAATLAALCGLILCGFLSPRLCADEPSITPPAGAALTFAEREAILAEIEKAGGHHQKFHDFKAYGNDFISVSFYGPGANEAILKKIAKLGNVRTLSLANGFDLTDDDMQSIGQMTSLQKLTIASRRITDAGLAHLETLKELEHFSNSETSLITDRGLATFRVLPKLKMVELYGDAITDEGLRQISPSMSISTVAVYGEGITDAGIRYLTKMPQLNDVRLSSQRITDDGLRLLTQLPKLTAVLLWGRKITDAGLAALGEIKTLNLIHLTNTPVTDDGLAHLADLEKLSNLSLLDTRVTGDGFKHLPSGITQLSIYGRELDDSAFAHLDRFPSLQNLSLGSMPPGRQRKITDDGLKKLARATSLKYLYLRHTAITDAGLEHLAALPELENIHLDDTPTVTKAGIDKLKAQRPKLGLLIGR